MATTQLSNPAGASGGVATQDIPAVVHVINNSGGTLVPGDVVVMDGTAGVSCTTTTSAKSHKALGAVAEPTQGNPLAASTTGTYASGAVIPVVVSGVARVNIASNTIADAAVLGTSTAAKVADTAGTPASGECFAIALEASTAKDANNTIRCWIGKF